MSSTSTSKTMIQQIRIGTRTSKLALVQTALVEQALRAVHPTLDIQIEHITTKGDVALDRPLREIGGAGLFVAAIEEALRTGAIDLAVHSAKDLPSTLPSDMTLAAFPARADARDALISRDGLRLAELPQGARIGTSSPRRICQLLHLRPDAQILDLRGNVDTRLRKLRDGDYDAIVLAKAGLDRLGLTETITEILELGVMLPAVAQGALALETRADDLAIAALLAPLDDQTTRLAALAERAFLARIGGGCHAPVAGYAEITGDMLSITGLLGALDGRVVHGTERGEHSADTERAAALGVVLAEHLLAAGGAELLREGDGDASQ